MLASVGDETYEVIEVLDGLSADEEPSPNLRRRRS
jgi:hypothetical protein